MITRFQRYLVCFCLMLLALPGYAGHDAGAKVGIEEIKIGQGKEALIYSDVEVHYSGSLQDGTVFDSSVDRGKPFGFKLGTGKVIPGWEIGIRGMKVGGKRRLTIPPELGYGAKGAGNVIPANATLIFEVELISLTPPSYGNIGNQQLAEKLAAGVKLIDIRRLDEWVDTGIVAGSVQATAFASNGEFQQAFLEKLKQTVAVDEEFALICLSGNRSAALANWLSTRGGYSRVLNVEKGIDSWISEGREVSKAAN